MSTSRGVGPAVEAVAVSKVFRLPHERRDRLRDYFLRPHRRTTYEQNQALLDVDLSVGFGEFFGIIGPNGSGKSTLLKVLAGIYKPTSGRVRINGRLSPFIELGVGFHPELTAKENVHINATLLGMTRAEIEAKFDEIIAFAELERFVDQRLKDYSTGMQLRLAYAVAIQAPFGILFLDEVLAVGDERFQLKCHDTFLRMHAEGRTVVLVSHNLKWIEVFCDRVLLLRNGVSELCGPPAGVIEHYVRTEST